MVFDRFFHRGEDFRTTRRTMTPIRPTVVPPAVFFSNLPAGYMDPHSPIGSVATSVEITPVDSSKGSTAPSSPLNLDGLHLDEPESPLSSTEGLNGSNGSEADDKGEHQVVEKHMDWEDNVSTASSSSSTLSPSLMISFFVFVYPISCLLL
ncbi:hypothetical protein B9Z55_027328 [Caenorhabditis nigoni]|uniref:Uncharacterized protein n=1 Tax=Caenorhabditis nigoni TaxID=1611254 RepID=A0A2G5SG40_9PELO|nr:hypothetical protein B9Z55_027328 [Caenorhabditis nigoni]